MKDLIEQLEKTYGTDAFGSAFDAVAKLPAAQVIEIARTWTVDKPRTKKAALTAIFRKHNVIHSAELHKKAVGKRIVG